MIFCDLLSNKLFKALEMPRDDIFVYLKFMIGKFPQRVSYVVFPGLRVKK